MSEATMTTISTDPLTSGEREMTVEEWLAIRKDAGLKIDPATAEVDWAYEYTLDPYGVYGDLPSEYRQIGREHFARSPGSDVWVWFGDLPEKTREALWERHESKLVITVSESGVDMNWGSPIPF
jgi:hypothetical protein